MTMASVDLGSLLGGLLFLGVVIALVGVFFLSLVRLLGYEVGRAFTLGQASVSAQPLPAAMPIEARQGLRRETILFMLGVAGLLASIAFGAASGAGLTIPETIAALTVIVAAVLVAARG